MIILDEEGSPRNNLFLISVDSRKKNCFTVARALLAKLKVDKLQMSKEHFRHKTAEPLT